METRYRVYPTWRVTARAIAHNRDMSEPHLIERACGGWLAVASKDSPVRIAVVATDEAGARAALTRSLGDWTRLLAAATVSHDARTQAP